MSRFRPQLQSLEAREVPALNLLYTGAALTLTGTPAAGPTESLRVENVGGDDYKVTDGSRNLGTYRVTTDIRIRVARFDTALTVDVGADTLGGDVLIDVGAGDTDPKTLNPVTVSTAAAGGTVAGDVTFRNGSGIESFNLSGLVRVGGSVRATGPAVTNPDAEDSLAVGSKVVVAGDVRTNGITYTTVEGTVGGDVVGNAAGSPGGMGFWVTGTAVVGGDVTAVGGATALPTPDRFWYSFARVGGKVGGDVKITAADGWALTSVRGKIDGDVRISLVDHAVPLRANSVGLGGEISGDVTVRSSGRLIMDSSSLLHGDLTVTATGKSVYLYETSLIKGDLRFKAGEQTNSSVTIGTLLRGSAVIDLGGSAGNTAGLTVQDGEYGGIEGDLVVRSRAGTTTVQVGYEESFEIEVEPGVFETWGYQTPGLIGGDMTIDLGNGTNNLVFNGAIGSTLGGKLTYNGGSGVDTITISGQNTFAAKIKTGAGSDTVAFAPDAAVGSLDIDFAAGVDAWTPPGVIAFPVKLKTLQ